MGHTQYNVIKLNVSYPPAEKYKPLTEFSYNVEKKFAKFHDTCLLDGRFQNAAINLFIISKGGKTAWF